jgi:hypothetical protein
VSKSPELQPSNRWTKLADKEAWNRAARAWYAKHARGLLDNERELLAVTLAPKPAVEIGALGITGVGKSSLLNAVLTPGVQLLPAGGVGALTGLPIRVTESSARSLIVRYRDRGWIHDRIAALAGPCPTPADIAQASLLCTGDPHGVRDPAWLIAAIRYALRPDLNPMLPEHEPGRDALHQLHLALQYPDTRTVRSTGPDYGELFGGIRNHTAGQLAPLCDSVEITWPSRFIPAGGALVDLPGLGALHDSYASRAVAWLAGAHAVVVVVDRAGLPEVLVSALQTTGFLGRVWAGLAWLAIAITKIDLTADDRWRDCRSTTWSEHYFAACQRAVTQMRAQLSTVLSQDPGRRTGRRSVDHQLSRISIIPVSSRERHRLQRPDDADRSRLRNPGSTGIPELQRSLRVMARLHDPFARAIDVALHARPDREVTELSGAWRLLLEQEEST